MIPVTIITPGAIYNLNIPSYDGLKALRTLAEVPGPKDENYTIRYTYRDVPHTINPVYPKAITAIMKLYEEGGFV